MRYTYTLITKFFESTGIRYSKFSLKKNIEKGICKNTLYELSYLLRIYGVDYEATNIKNLEPFENYFFVKYKGKFAYAHFLSEKELSVVSDKEEKASFEEFSAHIDNHLLIIVDYHSAGEHNYSINRREDTLKHLFGIVFMLCPILALFCVGVFNMIFFQPLAVLLFIINSIGLLLSTTIVSKRLLLKNSYTNVVDKLCRTNEENGTSGCDAAFKQILPHNRFLSLESLSITFFSLNFLCLSISAEGLPFVSLMYFCAIPFMVWSIIYQKMKLKKWCKLCLGIDASILAYLIVAFPLINKLFINVLYPKLIVWIATYAIIVYVAEKYLRCKELYIEEKKGHEQLLNKKFSYSEFERKLNDNPLVIQQDSPLNFIELNANKKAKYDIVIISNPYCAACANLHKRLSTLPHLFLKKTSIKIAFHSFSGKENVAIHLTELSQTNNAQELLDKWFEDNLISQNEILSLNTQMKISHKKMEEQNTMDKVKH